MDMGDILKRYKNLDFESRLKINLAVLQLRAKGYGSRKIVKILRDTFKIQIGRTTVRNIINCKTLISRVPEDVLKDAIRHSGGVKRRYSDLDKEERLKLKGDFDQLCSLGCGPYIAAKILELKYCVQLTKGLISGWYYLGNLPQGKCPTKLAPPTKELAIIAAVSISDGSLEDLKTTNRKCLKLQMKDAEPVELFAEQLAKLANRLSYRVSRQKSNQCFETKTYRKDLINYLQNEDHIIKLLRLYPSDSLKMLFEADGGVSGSISLKHSNKRICFQASVYLTNTKKWLLDEVSKLLDEMGIKNKVRLNVEAGTVSEIRGRDVITKKDCYILLITEKESIIRYSEKISFISKVKQERLSDVIHILERYGTTREAAIEWIRLYEPRRVGKQKWTKREQPLTREEAISALTKLFAERTKKSKNDHESSPPLKPSTHFSFPHF